MMRNRVLLAFVFLLLLQASSAFAVNPERGYRMKPGAYNIPYKEIFIATPDNAKLAVWIYSLEPSKSNGMTLIIAGGDAGNMSYSIYDAQQFVRRGFRVITFDYRGFGESTPFATTRDMLYYDEFCADAEAVVTFARRENPANTIVMLGHSMGSIVTFTLASKKLIDIAVADYPVHDVEVVAKRLKQQKNVTVTYPKSGTSLRQKIQTITIPLLAIAGESDAVTTLADAKAIASGRANRSWLSFKGGHGEAAVKLGERYYDEIGTFVSSKKLQRQK
jgi:uncharacterized protein